MSCGSNSNKICSVFSGMNEDQLQQMEGDERRNVEARIECLHNINLLLDAAMLHISQYVTVTGDRGRLVMLSHSIKKNLTQMCNSVERGIGQHARPRSIFEW